MFYNIRKNSLKWEEAKPIVSNNAERVLYRGKIIYIPAKTIFFIDKSGNVLVGWHGSVSPPLGMDGKSLVSS